MSANGGTKWIGPGNPSPGGGSTSVGFLFDRPSQVQRYLVTVPDGTRIDTIIEDGGLNGDHWVATCKVWDAKPNTAVASAPGPVGSFSAPARCFSYSAAGFMQMVVEVTYSHGINLFGASGDLTFTNTGPTAPTVTDLGITDDIK